MDIIVIPNNLPYKAELVLEQFFLLDPKFNLKLRGSPIKISNNPSGSNARFLYMYNSDFTILYYSSNQQIDFIRNLGISHLSFSKHLNNKTLFFATQLLKLTR